MDLDLVSLRALLEARLLLSPKLSPLVLAIPLVLILDSQKIINHVTETLNPPNSIGLVCLLDVDMVVLDTLLDVTRVTPLQGVILDICPIVDAHLIGGITNASLYS